MRLRPSINTARIAYAHVTLQVSLKQQQQQQQQQHGGGE